MQKFILIVLALGLAFFLYLLKTEQINKEDFSIGRKIKEADFEIRKNTDDLSKTTSDIYITVADKEYKIFTFTGDDFRKLLNFEYSQKIYKVPLEAKSAIAGTWIGNRYVFYILEKIDQDTEDKLYEVYKAEYPTDNVDNLEFYLIKSVSVKKSDTNNKVEVRY